MARDPLRHRGHRSWPLRHLRRRGSHCRSPGSPGCRPRPSPLGRPESRQRPRMRPRRGCPPAPGFALGVGRARARCRCPRGSARPAPCPQHLEPRHRPVGADLPTSPRALTATARRNSVPLLWACDVIGHVVQCEILWCRCGAWPECGHRFPSQQTGPHRVQRSHLPEHGRSRVCACPSPTPVTPPGHPLSGLLPREPRSF